MVRACTGRRPCFQAAEELHVGLARYRGRVGRVVSCGIFWGMGSSGLKQKMVETVEHLPEDATVEDAMERRYFLAKIERGLAESEAGETIPHEDVKKRFLG